LTIDDAKSYTQNGSLEHKQALLTTGSREWSSYVRVIVGPRFLEERFKDADFECVSGTALA
jgi:hypothetical protein